MPDRKFGFDTLCLHAGQIPDAATGARALPIYQTTSFVFDSADHAASLFNLQTFGNVYSRISNPTVCALEERVAALEGGRAALAAATGMAAQTTALLTLAKNGDHIVAARTLYGGTYTQFAVTFAEFGIDTTFVDPDDPDDFRRAVKPNTKLLYAETIGNPQLNVVDLAALADVRTQTQPSSKPSAPVVIVTVNAGLRCISWSRERAVRPFSRLSASCESASVCNSSSTKCGTTNELLMNPLAATSGSRPSRMMFESTSTGASWNRLTSSASSGAVSIVRW